MDKKDPCSLPQLIRTQGFVWLTTQIPCEGCIFQKQGDVTTLAHCNTYPHSGCGCVAYIVGLLFLQKRYNSIKEESLDIFGGVVLKYLWQGHTLIVNSILKVSQHIDLERELERFQDKRVDKCQDMLEI